MKKTKVVAFALYGVAILSFIVSIISSFTWDAGDVVNPWYSIAMDFFIAAALLLAIIIGFKERDDNRTTLIIISLFPIYFAASAIIGILRL